MCWTQMESRPCPNAAKGIPPMEKKNGGGTVLHGPTMGQRPWRRRGPEVNPARPGHELGGLHHSRGQAPVADGIAMRRCSMSSW